MIGNPTYEELEQRVKILEDKVAKSEQIEKNLIFKNNIISSSSSIIAICDLEGDMTYGNPTFIKAWGFVDPEEFLGRPFGDFWLAKHRLDEIMEKLQGEGVWFGELQAIRKDGTLFDVEISAATVFDSKGNPVALTSTSIDITARKRAEKELLESKIKYSKLFDVTPVPTVVINKKGEILDINKSHVEKIGGGIKKVEDYIGMNVLTHPSVEKAGVAELYRKALKGNAVEAKEVFYPEVTRGTEGYFDIKTSPLFDKNGDIGSIIITHQEITERKLSEETLKESERKYKTLFENAGDAIFFMEVSPENESWFIECNQRTFSLFGCESDDIVGKRPAFFSPEIQPDGKSSKEKTIQRTKSVMEGQPQYFQWLHHRYDNKEPFWVEVNLTPLTLGGKSNFIQAVVRDITDRKKAEELVQDLSRQLIQSQESERQMISYELHDSVAQDLSSAKINCEMLLKYKSLTPGARKQMLELSENLHKTLKSVRNLSYDLLPPGLEELGLIHTMLQFCKDFSEKTGVQFDFQSAGMENLNLSYNIKINLYRLLQESLNNVKKHADASNVKVKIISSFPNVILRIHDDGKGFDLKERLTKTSREKKMGLNSMEHRVDLLSGWLNIESIPGKGTEILIEIPQKDKNMACEEGASLPLTLVEN